MSVRIPQFSIGLYPEPHLLEQTFRQAESAETSGLDFVSMVDHPYRPHFLETWTLLTLLAARTQRIRLQTNVLCLPLRQPALLAKAAQTLSTISGGRYEYGLGAGGYWDAINSYSGPRRTPGEAFQALEEAIQITRLLWGQQRTGEVGTPVSFHGDFYHLHEVVPGPALTYPIGIWIGSVGPRMCRLIGRAADGWIVSNIFRSFEEALPLQQLVDEAAYKAGRQPSDIQRWYNLWGAIRTPAHPHPEPPRPNAFVGTVDEWVEQIVRYHQELRMDIFDFWNTTAERERQARLFAEEVVPAARAALRTTAPL